MRIKIVIVMLVLASLACTANVSTLKPPATSFPKPASTVFSEPTQLLPAASLDSQPLVVPDGIDALYMLGTQNGWMITTTSVLRTEDGGATWHDVTPSGVSTLGYETGASFLDSNRGWILVPGPNDLGGSGTLYHTIDGGLQWSANSVPFGSRDIHFLDDVNAWAMVYAGHGERDMAVKFYQTTDGGVNWSRVYSNLQTDPDASTSLPLNGVKSGFTPISMQEAWVSGNPFESNIVYLYHTLDGGRSWSAVDPHLPFGGDATYLTSPPVFFGSQIGLLPTMAGSEGSGTFFFITQDGGNTWTAGAGVPGSGLTSVVSPNDVYILFSGVIFVSHDATQTWTSVTPNVDLTSKMVTQFQFVDIQTGWVVLSDASSHTSLYKTTDGGQTWAAQVP
jgi:photosystem II stability/assembly factor-like uncharacterized protein